MYTTKSESSAALRQLIYSRAQQMSRQITQAAEEFGMQAAEQRERMKKADGGDAARSASR